MAYYRDLREHIKALEANGKLVRVRREINKDTELMPLVRWQFRGLPEEERKAFLFEKVVDAKGRSYSMPVLVASHAASTEVYAMGMMCKPADIVDKWAEAQLHPVKPRLVKDGPVHEEVFMGDGLLERGGLDELPVPISTPGFDNAPYFTAGNWVTKDPETGLRNIGNYRAMIKSRTRTGVFMPPPQHMRTHWEKRKQQGKPLEAAVVIGAVPVIGYVATMKFAYEVDEYDIAGGVAGEPIELLKCKTVDIEVPATAEIVVEGELPTDSLEREAPFGEYTGYMGVAEVMPYFNVTCVTHRRSPIYSAFLSQFPPSESRKLSNIGFQATLYKFLRHDCGLPILEVALHENCGSVPYCVIRMKKTHPSEPWRALNGTMSLSPRHKFVIAVDEDIDARDPDSVNWALGWAVQPNRDVRVVQGIFAPLDYSTAPPGQRGGIYPAPAGASAMLIDATRKWDYPPVSLPRKEFMERAKEIWEELGLPRLSPKTPWHGYSLGYWTKENAEEAELAVKGEHYETGDKLAKERVKS